VKSGGGPHQSMVITVMLVEDEEEARKSKYFRCTTQQVTLAIKLRTKLTILHKPSRWGSDREEALGCSYTSQLQLSLTSLCLCTWPR